MRCNTLRNSFLRAAVLSILVVILFGAAGVATADAPDVSRAKASVQTIWSPNHKFVPISITGISTSQSSSYTIHITACTSDEPVDAITVGTECPDAIMRGSEVLLRAERMGSGNGRVYVIHFEATNEENETSRGSVEVHVPHDQSPKCIDDGQFYNVDVCGTEGTTSPKKILSPNLPNPFNPVTRISYELPSETSVRLSVFDASGHEVSTLVSGVQSAGTHTVTWEATGMPSGVYFYRIIAGSIVDTRKMVLLK